MVYSKENYGGIYAIRNLINGKKYIGQTIDFENREKLHFSYLKNGTHDNPHLQYSYNKYGQNNFEFKIILYCEQFEMTRYEQAIIDSYDPNELYNIRLECVDSNLGLKHTPEELEKMRQANLGENNPMWGKFGEQHPMYGIRGKDHPLYGISPPPRTEEQKRRLADSLRGRKSNKKTYSKYVGVSYNKNHKKWIAMISRYRKRYFLGYFKNEEDAALAYNKKAIEFGVPEERLNKIERK